MISASTPRVEPVRPAVSAPAVYHDPVWLVQRAWSVFRLPALQEVIKSTIAQLHDLAPRELLGREVPPPSTGTQHPDPVSEAFTACSEELRDASGMAGSHEQRAAHCSLVRLYTAQQPVAWSEAFSEALDKYRRAACAALGTALQSTSIKS